MSFSTIIGSLGVTLLLIAFFLIGHSGTGYERQRHDGQIERNLGLLTKLSKLLLRIASVTVRGFCEILLHRLRAPLSGKSVCG